VPSPVPSILRTQGQFYGTSRRTLTLAGHTCSEISHPPRSVTPDHHHQNAFLCIVVSGTFTALRPLHTEYRPGALVFHPAGEVHAERFTKTPVQTLNVEFTGGEPPNSRDGNRRTTAPWALTDAATGWLGDLIYRECSSPDEMSDLSVASALALIFVGQERLSHSRRDPAIRRALAVMHDCFREALTLERLSGISGLPPGRLVAAFVASTGRSPAHYQRELRLRNGIHLLCVTDDPIAQVAAAAGFSDQSHFTHAFKRATGSTPRAFRRSRGGRSSNVQTPPSFLQDFGVTLS
jgi:AraC family transcriptional regulator